MAILEDDKLNHQSSETNWVLTLRHWAIQIFIIGNKNSHWLKQQTHLQTWKLLKSLVTLKDERLVLWSPETHHAIKALHQRTSLRHEDVEILGDGSCEEEIFHPRQSLAQADSATWKRPLFLPKHYQHIVIAILEKLHIPVGIFTRIARHSCETTCGVICDLKTTFSYEQKKLFFPSEFIHKITLIY